MINECNHCGEKFKWNDDVIIVDDCAYHKSCVTLYPTSYIAFTGDICLGETDNDDGEMAYEYFEELLEEVDE